MLYNSQRKDIYVFGHRNYSVSRWCSSEYIACKRSNEGWIEFEGDARKDRLTLKMFWLQ
jgi:hypothetical protein